MTNKTIFKIGMLISLILLIIGIFLGGIDVFYCFLVCAAFLGVVILFLLFIVWVLDDDYSIYQNLDEKKEEEEI